ncbi:hypothetical protein D3C85_1456220 [compost metagenome]
MQLKSGAGGDIDPGVETQCLFGCGELRRGASVRPWQPAAIDQQPQSGRLILKGLQQLDADLAVALAVVQQQAVRGIELAVQANAAERRILGALQFSTGHRFGDPAFGIGLQQRAFLRAPAQLPEPE